MGGRHYRLSREDLEFVAQDIGAELVKFLSPEERLKGLSLEERLHGLSPKERLRGLSIEERLRGLDANGLRKLKQILDNFENSREREKDK